MDLVSLNKISMQDFLPKKKVSELTVGKHYCITALKEVNTRFGLKVVADFDESFQIFFPPKISAALQKDPAIFERLQNSANKLSLSVLYQGGNSFQFNNSS